MTQRSPEQHTTDETPAPRPYPGADDPVEHGGPSRSRKALLIAVAVLVLLMLVALHLTGAIGSGAH